SGFIGRRVREQLRDHEFRAVSLRGDLRPENFAGLAAVVHLGGEPVAQRWTAAARLRILRSRVDGTRRLVEALKANPPAVLISASAIGYYGSRGDEILTETSSGANDFLGQVAQEWERAALAAESFGVRVVILRIAMVLGRGGGALAKMLTPFRLGIGGRIGSGKQWMSWIHLDDLAALIAFALEHPTLRGAVNASAPEPVTNAEFTRELARALHRPAIFPVPEAALKLMFGEMSQMILASERVLPEAALRAGFSFRFPRIREALRDLV
ncbi:MAG TPA: TIGR01777 family oxidoreductase, partial [Bryobacteraceae bacterium]|nr:TIGR01777 family oxidoreductase [Bryobacteraceae bacterium]